MAALESASAPRCPTIITDTTCRRYCNTDTATIGAAIQPAFFSSWTNPSHVIAHFLSSLFPSPSITSQQVNEFCVFSLLEVTARVTLYVKNKRRDNAQCWTDCCVVWFVICLTWLIVFCLVLEYSRVINNGFWLANHDFRELLAFLSYFA